MQIRSFIVFMFFLMFQTIVVAETLTEETSEQVSSFALEPSALQDYHLGTGDVIRVTVYGNPDLTTEARVAIDKKITFPLIGDVEISQLTAKEAQQKIAAMLEEKGFVKNAKVNVLVTQYQSQFVTVMGEVSRPGKFALDKATRLVEVLGMAGGVNPIGSEWVNLIRDSGRGTRSVAINLREFFSNGNTSHNPVVYPGDVIMVNSREISVFGQVNRPGKYAINQGVHTVLDFIAQAGGVAANGSDKVVVMSRRTGDLKKYEFDLDAAYKAGAINQDFELVAGDSIYVPRFPVFYIHGEVQRPGVYRLERGMFLSQALSAGGGVSLRGSERRIEIRRMVDGALTVLDAQASDKIEENDVIYIKERIF